MRPAWQRLGKSRNRVAHGNHFLVGTKLIRLAFRIVKVALLLLIGTFQVVLRVQGCVRIVLQQVLNFRLLVMLYQSFLLFVLRSAQQILIDVDNVKLHFVASLALV